MTSPRTYKQLMSFAFCVGLPDVRDNCDLQIPEL